MAGTDGQNVVGKKPLTPDMVVGRALVLADAGGLGDVTIRRLAGDLRVTPMALYWHFRNKDELLDAMVGRVFAEVDLVLDESATWLEQFRALMDSLAGVLRARLARSAVGELLLDLAAGGSSLRDALSRALHDPSLDIVYWLPQRGHFVWHEAPGCLLAAMDRLVAGA